MLVCDWLPPTLCVAFEDNWPGRDIAVAYMAMRSLPGKLPTGDACAEPLSAPCTVWL